MKNNYFNCTLLLILTLVPLASFGQHLIYSNDFSNPSDWTMTNTSSPSRDWVISTSLPLNLTNQGFTSTINSASGGNFAWIDSDSAPGGTQDAYLTLVNPVDCSGHSAVKLTFQNYHRRYMETHTVQVSNDNGSSWTEYPVNTGYPVNTTSPNPETVSLDISAVAANQENVRIRFRYRGAWDWFWAIDDVALVADIPPTIITVSPHSAVPGSSIIISGEHFNTTAADNIVYFGGVKATVTSAAATSLTVTVPAGAAYAPITVLNTGNALSASSPQSFHPVFAPSKKFIEPDDIAVKADFPTGEPSITIAYGDLDGDGKPDMAVTNGTGHSISVFLNTGSEGNASFTRQDISLGISATVYGLAIGDIDGDGKPDLAVTVTNGNYVSVFRNISSGPGNIGFAAEEQFVVQSSPLNLVIGDVDGDGRADLAVTNSGTNSFSILRNTGSPGTISFEAHASYATGSTAPDGIALRDINLDGKPDVITVNRTSNSISVFPNSSDPGSLSFGAQIDGITGSGPTNIAVGDMDGDGMPDIAVTNQNSDNVSVFRNAGSAGAGISLGAAQDFAVGDQPVGISIGDINGDGKVDLIVANYNDNNVSVLRNSGSGTLIDFSHDLTLTAGTNPRSVALTDLDGNGKPDIMLANQGSDNVSVFLNRLITAPQIQASDIQITDLSPFTATMSWTNGSGENRGVFIKADDTGTPIPTDGTDYVADAEFGSGDQIGSTGWYAVYNGTGSNVTVTGLQASRRYMVMVVEFNDGGQSGMTKYNTTAATDNPVSFNTPTTLDSITRDTGTTPVNTTTVAYTVAFGAAVSGLTAANFSLTASSAITGAGVQSVTGSGATYTVTVNTGSGDGTLVLNLANATGLTPMITSTLPFVGDTYTIDKTAPVLSAVAITSSNTNVSLAKSGDMATLTFTANETITPTVTIAGHNVIPENSTGNSWKATYTFLSSDTEGPVTYHIAYSDLAGNPGIPVTAGTGSITFDPTAPAVPTGLLAAGENQQVVLNWTANSEVDLSTYRIFYGTNPSPTTFLSDIAAGTTTYTHHSLINGTTYFYSIHALDKAGNMSAAGTEASAIPKALQTITFDAITAKIYTDAAFVLGDATSSGGLTVTYTAEDPTVVSISGNVATILKAGTTRITASQAGNATHAPAADVSQTLRVTPATLTVTANGGQSKMYGESDPKLTYKATGYRLGENNSLFTGALSRSLGENAGDYTITQGDLSGGENYTITFIGADFVIKKAPQKITFVSPGTLSRDVGMVDLDVSSNSGLPVILTTDDEMIATINSSSLVMTVKRQGSVTLTATQPGNVNYEAAQPISMTIHIAGDYDALLPVRVHQALSPNGDGINDFLMIEGIRDYPENRVVIFDRYGRLIAKIEGYDNRERVFTGLHVYDGTYYYYLDIKDGNTWKRGKGFFVVKRTM